MKSTKTSIVVAATALVVAVFGSTPLGHAAGRLVLPPNSVGTAQLKSSSVTGAKIKDGTLTAAKFKSGQLLTGSQGPKGEAGPKGDKGEKGDPGAQGANGEQGAKGEQGVKGEAGAQGQKGDTGAAGISGYHLVTSSSQGPVAPGQKTTIIAYCAAGEKALSGGYATVYELKVAFAAPLASGLGYGMIAVGDGAGSGMVYVYAVCATVS